MIDRATVDRIMDAAQIVDVVSDFVTLRKAGVNYKGFPRRPYSFVRGIPIQRPLQMFRMWKRRQCRTLHHGARTTVLSRCPTLFGS